MGLACDVYTRLMFQRGHGLPLWEPEPTKSGEVLIGDVGYVLDGGFYRLFNATLPADHPVNERCGVPEGYEPFTYPDTLLHRRPSALNAGPICSKSVVAVEVGASVEVGVVNPGAMGRLRFKCADEQGAILVLKREGTREALHPCKDLTRYILRNHATWHRFAQDVYRLDIEEHNILFVSGSVKTAEWALAAATHRAREGEIVFGGEFGPSCKAAFSVSATQSVSLSVEHRHGPERPEKIDSEEDPPHDQCVFMHYYKLKRRRVIGPKVIRAAAESASSSRSSSPGDIADDVPLDSKGTSTGDTSFGSLDPQLEIIPKSQYSDPLEGLCDYILDNSEADCVLVSDADLLEVYPDLAYVGLPDNIYEYLSQRPPRVTVLPDERVGILEGAASLQTAMPPHTPEATASFRIRSPLRSLYSPGSRRRTPFAGSSRRTPRIPRRLIDFLPESTGPYAGLPPLPPKSVDFGVSSCDIGRDVSVAVKRTRGRPPGSKNKSTLAKTVTTYAPSMYGPYRRKAPTSGEEVDELDDAQEEVDADEVDEVNETGFVLLAESATSSRLPRKRRRASKTSADDDDSDDDNDDESKGSDERKSKKSRRD